MDFPRRSSTPPAAGRRSPARWSSARGGASTARTLKSTPPSNVPAVTLRRVHTLDEAGSLSGAADAVAIRQYPRQHQSLGGRGRDRRKARSRVGGNHRGARHRPALLGGGDRRGRRRHCRRPSSSSTGSRSTTSSGHLFAGIWGIAGGGDLLVQITGILAIGAFVFAASWVVWWVIDATIGARVTAVTEELGQDASVILPETDYSGSLPRAPRARAQRATTRIEGVNSTEAAAGQEDDGFDDRKKRQRLVRGQRIQRRRVRGGGSQRAR